MSFFTRLAVVALVVGSVVHVFRKDIVRVAGVLKKPTENFIREVKRELDTGAVQKLESGIKNPLNGASSTSKTTATHAREAAKRVEQESTTTTDKQQPPLQ